MDVLQLLDDELKKKNNWSLEEKARHLYIRSCQLFSYDPRYRLFLKLYSREKVSEIVLRDINLRNVIDFRVVCTNYSRYVFKGVAEELLNLQVDVCGSGHEYNMIKLDNSRFIVDVTNECDLERVKMGLRTEGYYDLDIGRTLNNQRLEKIDQKTNYIEEEYFADKLKRIIDEFESEYRNKKISEVDYLLAKIYRVKELFDEINVFREYSDAIFCINYLLDEFFGKSVNYFKRNKLYEMTKDDDYLFRNLLDVTFIGEKFNFILERVDDKYEFYKIPLSEGGYYKKEFSLQKKI